MIDRLVVYMLQTAFGAAGTGVLAYITVIQNRFTLGSARAANRGYPAPRKSSIRLVYAAIAFFLSYLLYRIKCDPVQNEIHPLLTLCRGASVRESS